MSKRSRKGGTKNPPAVEIPKEKITEEMTCEFCHKGETKDIVQSGKLYKLTTGEVQGGVGMDLFGIWLIHCFRFSSKT